MPSKSYLKRSVMQFYAKPLFRTCEIICNHAARLADSNGALARPQAQAELQKLDELRKALQSDLHRIGESHGEVCAKCKGKCCGGVRERDAFTDRVIQDPQTPYRSARRKEGQQVAYKKMGAVAVLDAEPVEGHCIELTTRGCRIPYELRPIQCTAYFCGDTIEELSDEERNTGIRALSGLMGVQVKTVLLAIRSRFTRGRG